MKKAFNFKSLAMMIAMISAMSFTSCTPEPEKEKTEETQVQSIDLDATFGFAVSEQILASYDITAEILLDGSTFHKEVVKTDIWSYEINLDKVNISSISCKVIANAKETLPKYEADTKYEISISAWQDVAITKNKQATTLLPSRDSSVKSSTMTISSNKMAEYVINRPTINLINVDYKLQ